MEAADEHGIRLCLLAGWKRRMETMTKAIILPEPLSMEELPNIEINDSKQSLCQALTG